MKISLAKAEDCIVSYVNREICPKLIDWRKWVIPVVIGSYMPTLEKMFFDNRDTLLGTGFVDNENMIDIDSLYDRFHKVAEENGEIRQQLPMLGEVTFSVNDIEALYRLTRM